MQLSQKYNHYYKNKKRYYFSTENIISICNNTYLTRSHPFDTRHTKCIGTKFKAILFFTGCLPWYHVRIHFKLIHTFKFIQFFLNVLRSYLFWKYFKILRSYLFLRICKLKFFLYNGILTIHRKLFHFQYLLK
jgi:hypothetical protein